MLEYPFDAEFLLKKSKSIKRELISADSPRIPQKIAVLGGSTTHDIIRMLDLFLLDQGFAPEFYESEYNQYYQDAMFDPPALSEFTPDLIFIHTGYRNIENIPTPGLTAERVSELLNAEFERFKSMWDHLSDKYKCPVIQNNFEYPYYRIMGNYEAVDVSGTVRFVSRLNEMFADHACSTGGLYIHDINYLSAAYGLDKWCDPAFWNMYKYQMCMQAIPDFAFSLSHICKAIWGRNKKAFALDLDNTLWGGIVGDDGPEGLEIGMETPLGQTFTEFQTYLKKHKDIGVLLNVDSKNEEENALAGLNHPAEILHPDDFIEIRANWEPKSLNLESIASSINIGTDAFVFIDDNPAERMIVEENIPGVSVPDIGQPEEYIRRIDKNAYFEVIGLSDDDRKRNEMYKANAGRAKAQAAYTDYNEYLRDLKMTAVIRPFEQVYYNRISQLTGKSNQFNLTTLRCSVSDIEKYAEDPDRITLYGQLSDRFGDNGIVSLIMGRADRKTGILHMELWLMSCRVLKRNMEGAMLDALVKQAVAVGLTKIRGYYYPTAKNAMVKDFYKIMGFSQITEPAENELAEGMADRNVDAFSIPPGSSVWELDISTPPAASNDIIEVTT